MNNPNEERFEKHIEQTLVKHGYEARLYTEYDKNQCQLQEELITFIKETQQEETKRITQMLTHPSALYPLLAIRGNHEEV